MRSLGSLIAPHIVLAGVLVAQTQPGVQDACSYKSSLPAGPRRGMPAAYADPSIDVTYYRLDLRIASTPAFLQGSVQMKAKCITDSLSSIVLDLTDAMHLDSIQAVGKPLSFIQFPSVVQISLDRSYRLNEMLTVTLFYHGTPATTGFGSFEFSQHASTPWIWSLSEPYGARDWWPCKDHPVDKADSVDVIVTCDAALKVGSNGRLVSVVDNGDATRTTHWSERYPIATYLVSIALTNYAEFTNWFRYSPTDSMMILNYVLPEHLTDALTQLPKTVSMLEIFSQAYGLYPFISEKYGHAEFGRGGAMEHQTMTSTMSFEEDVISHELAHQWFGDLITCRTWQHLWLNEGFASYSEAIYRERMYGLSAYWSSISARMDLALQAVGTLYVQDTSTVRSLFDSRLVYSKGASVLHMLRHILGDSVFFSALRAYVSEPTVRFKTATTEDFQRVCEAVSGRSLGYFFREWIYGESHPRYSYRWSAAPRSGRFDVTLHIEQATNTTNPPFFTMPIDVRLAAGSWDTVVVVVNRTGSEDFVITASHMPATVELDPGHWILREIETGNPDLPTLFTLDQNFPNPFNGGTTIRYGVPGRRKVELAIFNLLGEEVAVLESRISEPGTHAATWDGTGRNGVPLPSGVYFYRLTSEGYAQARRLLLLR